MIGSASAGGGGWGPGAVLEAFGSDADRKAFDGGILRRLLSFLAPHRARMAAAAACVVAASAASLAAPYLVKAVIDGPVASGNTAELPRLVGLLALAYLAAFAATASQRYLLSWVGQRLLLDLRARLFGRLQAVHLGYHDEHIVGVTISRVVNDVGTINDLLSQGLVSFLGDVLILAGTVVVMVGMSPGLALLTFSVIPLMLLATLLFAAKARVAFKRTRSAVASVVGNLAENIAGMRAIQAFAQEGSVLEKFDRHNVRNMNAHVQAMSLSYAFIPVVDFLSALAMALVLLFGGLASASGKVSLGVLVAFLAYSSRFFQPIRDLSQLYTTMQAAMAGAEQVFRILDTESAVLDAPDAVDAGDVEGRVEFRSVSFSYRRGEEVLRDVDLVAEKGNLVAIVGPTGAGKSTLANLIYRFYDVGEGGIYVDGKDIRKITQYSLRTHMALVPQEPFLFSGTIADNILFSRPGSPFSAVEEASRAANAHPFISDLPRGYETLVYEGGSNLSVGQRQLLCIARAILADPRILVMDEATANIDNQTEARIREALDRLFHGRTAIVIAHRLATIARADMIYFLEDGKVAESGTHAELLRAGGKFALLHASQFGGRAGGPQSP